MCNLCFNPCSEEGLAEELAGPAGEQGAELSQGESLGEEIGDSGKGEGE
jgi:hypothetical protein